MHPVVLPQQPRMLASTHIWVQLRYPCGCTCSCTAPYGLQVLSTVKTCARLIAALWRLCLCVTTTGW